MIHTQLVFDFENSTNEIIIGDISNIKSMMPYLFDTQAEDVSFAEKRFQTGKGYLFTNGTGTGKTFVGLGISKRFYVQDKRDILIVVPTEKKCSDWMKEGNIFELDIYQLKDIQDPGKEITVTTYANFYQNSGLLSRNFDLVIYDESHYLNQNAQGSATTYYEKHVEVAKLPSSVKRRVRNFKSLYSMNQYGREIFDVERFESIVSEIVEKTKVVFLSATPFAYHKSIKYGDGCLFDINETIQEDDSYYGYNEASGWNKFMTEHFGYRMRYNRCTVPESGVDVNLLERNFFENFKKNGILSTRQINLEFDYSREFIILNSEIGHEIEKGFELFYDKDFISSFPNLCGRVGKKYNSLYINQLLECIKAREIYFRIKQHLELGRKVVVFHNYNNSLPSHPFRFSLDELLFPEEDSNEKLEKEIENFKNEYSHFWNLDLSQLINVRETLKKLFPQAKEFNGTINKKLRGKYIDDFNSDNSETNLIICQEKAGREGISMHDKTGIHQRVLINLGLPTAPVASIQIEGRIYREGLKSNAIYEYATIQTTTERFAFADKIATRSKTAENLAMGNLARDLETAFKEGYKNAHTEDPSINHGIGGKEADRFLYNISEFERAKTFYFARGKKTAANKSKEGIDYFATPEPLGLKMVEWLNPEPNDNLLEPSAGHGGIARFFPGNTNNHFIEPSHYLASELSLNAQGTVHKKSFENYYVGNKFAKICMNPPFGFGGKTAIEHIAKACKHLDWFGGEVIAIIPNGPAMQKKLDAFMNDKNNMKLRLTGEIILPQCTFERAGTSVSCKIIRIQDGYLRSNYKDYNRIDLSHINTIKEFFDTIENLEF